MKKNLRAWLRLAVMQKKLADYLQELVERRDTVLIEYYEPHALMMSDEVNNFLFSFEKFFNKSFIF